VTSPLKIEVTEAMREAGVLASNEYWAREIVPCEKCLSTGAFDGDLCPSCGGGGYTANGDEVGAIQAALTAAFQHPEFVEQIRRQVNDAIKYDLRDTRANLAGLLGEEG
jgi:RecJ-like exonuclease